MRVLIFCATLFFWPFAVAGQPTPPWQKLEYSASYLWASASAKLSLDSISVASATSHWMTPANTRPIYPKGDMLWHLHIDNQIESNSEVIDSWLDPLDLRAYQRDRLSSGKQTRLKRYRYLRQGVYRARSEPDTADTSQPLSWPVSSGANFQPPEQFREKVVVTTPYGVLLAASVAPLNAIGDSHTVYVFTDIDYLQVTLKVSARKQIESDYWLDGVQQTGSINALVINLAVKPLGTEAAHDKFSLLGFEGKIAILLDPVTRLPVEVRGELPKLGKQSIKLQQASVAAR